MQSFCMIVIHNYSTNSDKRVWSHYRSSSPLRSQMASVDSSPLCSPSSCRLYRALSFFLLNASMGVTMHSITSFLFDQSWSGGGKKSPYCAGTAGWRAGPLGVSCKLTPILHHVYLEGGTDSFSAICASVLQDDFDLDCVAASPGVR